MESKPKSKKFKPAINISPSLEELKQDDKDILNYPMSIDTILSVENDQEVLLARFLLEFLKSLQKQKTLLEVYLVAELFEARKPKDPAIMSEIEGKFLLVKITK